MSTFYASVTIAIFHIYLQQHKSTVKYSSTTISTVKYIQGLGKMKESE